MVILVLCFIFILEVYLIEYKPSIGIRAEFVDFDMLYVVNKVHLVVVHQSSSYGTPGSKLKGKFVPYYKKEEKRISNLYENSSDDEVKCRMAQTVKSHTDTSHDSIGILNVDSPDTADNLKSEWEDTSVYQGKEQIWYLDNSCSIHMKGFNSLQENFIKKDGMSVIYGNNGKGTTMGYGTIKCNSVFSIITSLSINCVTLAMKFSLTDKKEKLLVKRASLFLLQIDKMKSMFWIGFLLTNLFVVPSSLVLSLIGYCTKGYHIGISRTSQGLQGISLSEEFLRCNFSGIKCA
uniref:Uncharacterized protein n=1 Tax=Lactuca sativa TaxID=4236 RepID=A0A9R1UF18_LACSA|nr:hypothetical protein LSAT_V11C900484500 [Lactuca sativa]